MSTQAIQEVIALLKEKADKKHHEGMTRFGVSNEKALGVKIPEVRKLAKLVGKDYALAQELWDTDIHETRILAALVDEPKLVTTQQMDAWTKAFTTWDVCDQVCGNLFDRTPYAIDKVFEYSKNEAEFVKRAGFVLMAELALHDKKAKDEVFMQFFPVMERERGMSATL